MENMLWSNSLVGRSSHLKRKRKQVTKLIKAYSQVKKFIKA